MGLFTGLLTLPLAPVRGVVWVAEKVRDQAEHEAADHEGHSERLAEIERAREAGEISDEQAEQREDEILYELGW